MQVTITGGAGNLALYIIRELEREHEIVLFDRIAPGDDRAGYRSVVGDLTDFDACQRAVAGSQAVIHLGGIIEPVDHPEVIADNTRLSRPILPWDETMRVNTMGTFYLVEAARRAGVKTVVAASSNCVLGHGYRLSGTPFPFRYLPVDEEHPLDFEDSYSLSKHVVEDILTAYSRAYGMRCYAIRPAYINRPDMLERFAQRYQPPSEWSDWLWSYAESRDMARAFRQCLEAGAAGHLPSFDAYYVNAADMFVLEDTRTLVERLKPSFLPILRDVSGRQALISTKKAERAFGYRAEHSWTEYLPVRVGP